MPTGVQIKSSHKGHIVLPGLPGVKFPAYVLPDLMRHSLLSLGVLCDAGLSVYLDSDKIEFYHKKSLVLSGVRDETTGGLWVTDLPAIQHVAMNLYPTGTIAKLVAFYHGCFCSPTIPTFKKVLELGTPLPGIEIKDINKYPPITPATAAGHLDGTRWVKARNALKDKLVDIGDSERVRPPPRNKISTEGSICVCQRTNTDRDQPRPWRLNWRPSHPIQIRQHLFVVHGGGRC